MRCLFPVGERPGVWLGKLILTERLVPCGASAEWGCYFSAHGKRLPVFPVCQKHRGEAKARAMSPDLYVAEIALATSVSQEDTQQAERFWRMAA